MDGRLCVEYASGIKSLRAKSRRKLFRWKTLTENEEEEGGMASKRIKIIGGGQNFAGLSANSVFYNLTTAIAMMVGRLLSVVGLRVVVDKCPVIVLRPYRLIHKVSVGSAIVETIVPRPIIPGRRPYRRQLLHAV